jgi:hypothetical protein
MVQVATHRLFRSLSRLGVAFVIAAFMVVSLGPIIDHHFPEHNPFHLHLYFDSASSHLSHSHPYQTFHDHSSHSHQTPSSSDGPETVYLSPSGGLSNVITLMPPIPIQQTPVHSQNDNVSRLYRTLSDDLLQYASHIPLTKKPPRV